MRLQLVRLFTNVAIASLSASAALANGLPQSQSISGASGPAHDSHASALYQVHNTPDGVVAERSLQERFAIFTPSNDPIRHRIDYTNWSWLLSQVVISMGPSLRKRASSDVSATGSRVRQGHNSPYRLEGSAVIFNYLTESDTPQIFADYRRELEGVSDTLDIASLPRNEQLAFWFNLHNAAMLEQLAQAWPVRQPREIEIDGSRLDDAKFLTVRGIPMSLRDIRENIVYANWRNPKVIYGFWRGEIGGPALESTAFTGSNVNSLLDYAAEDFVNSLRGTEKRGTQLMVSTLFEETQPFYFRDFEPDVRAHIAEYAKEDVQNILDETQAIRVGIREWDIADLSGGRRPINIQNIEYSMNPMFSDGRPSSRVPFAVFRLLNERQRKLQLMQRREIPTGRVIFSNIDLPGDPPNKNAIE